MLANVRAALLATAARYSDETPSADTLEAALLKRYAAFDAWPADGQLGLLILGWALGPGFSLPGLKRSLDVLVPDFMAASRAVQVDESKPTLIVLGGLARGCFRNAALVCRWNLRDEVLYWPSDLALSGATV